ncbi:hypothetical protein JOC75_003331 [Metabacillus crassostreae]|uniref:DUF4240 domain-containing protein n=1 Tax=Metabacillus crassostreae TaxID=929098 RepID=UPI00195E8042|nr:DUF4240 domain-containing protein [Metabacillus crassostreae]MBM7605308.1 hypothetical protein [Metabacillus crassostreae]
MDQKELWSLIEKSREFDDQAEWLTELLAEKELEEVVEYEFLFQELMNASYNSRLWGAAFVLMGGCSDDAFDYFRGWLIGQGEVVFNKGLRDPEFLAEYINEDNLDDEGYPQNEELLSVGLDAYTLIKTGDIEWDDNIHDELLEALDKKGLQPVNDIEFDWGEDDLENLFPVLWERFGEDPLG